MAENSTKTASMPPSSTMTGTPTPLCEQTLVLFFISGLNQDILHDCYDNFCCGPTSASSHARAARGDENGDDGRRPVVVPLSGSRRGGRPSASQSLTEEPPRGEGCGGLLFGLVAQPRALGAWGRADPLPLFHNETASAKEGRAVYVGCKVLPTAELQLLAGEGEEEATLECRLVVLDRGATGVPSATGPHVDTYRQCPGAAIVAVECQESQPTMVRMKRWQAATPEDGYSLDLAAVPHLDAHTMEGLQQCTTRWKCSWSPPDPSALVFRSAREQFPFLHLLPPHTPAELLAQKLQTTTAAAAGGAADHPRPQAGPALSLTLYTANPKEPFHYDLWLEAQPPQVRAALALLSANPTKTSIEDGGPLPETNSFRVSSVHPAPLLCSCWCGPHLPTPSPVKQRLEEARERRHAKRDAAAGGAATTASGSTPSKKYPYIPSSSSCFSTHTETGEEVLDPKGWCLRPLRRIAPVYLGAGPLISQTCWNCVVDLAFVEDYALEVQVEVPVVDLRAAGATPTTLAGGEGQAPPPPTALQQQQTSPIRWIKGRTVLVPSMFERNTKDVLQLPVACQDEKNTVWVVLFLQYLVAFPYNHDRNDLRVVRSQEGFARLTIPSLVGHRGLGKTYTRNREKGLMTKLAENSINSFNAAYRRGCEMVEFDVMLTWDRVPIVFHDAFLRLQAREKQLLAEDGTPSPPSQGTAAGTTTVTTGGVVAPGDYPLPPATLRSNAASFHSVADDGTDVLFRDDDGGLSRRDPVLTRLQSLLAHEYNHYAPIAVPVHSLTKRQLDAVVTESFEFTQPPCRLKLLVIRHWSKILRVYRNRNRLQCLRDHSLVIEPADRDEFRGCRTTGPGGPLSIPGSGFTTPIPSHYQDPLLGVIPYLDRYRTQRVRETRFLGRQQDITNTIPALHELFERTPVGLRMNIEVKYPFQPRWENNLFEQIDAFEVNGFVDAVLDVVFAYADAGREVAFSSFDPDICLALSLKQSRYHVLFLSDTEEKVDLKDYRSFYVEGALQFASLHYLAGISIAAATLCGTAPAHQDLLHLKVPEAVVQRQARHLRRLMRGKATKADEHRQIPLLKDLHAIVASDATATTPNNNSNNKTDTATTAVTPNNTITSNHKTAAATAEEEEEKQYEQAWADFNPSYGSGVVAEAHRRSLKVWTWGGANVSLRYDCVQSEVMHVDGIITDYVPVISDADA